MSAPAQVSSVARSTQGTSVRRPAGDRPAGRRPADRAASGGAAHWGPVVSVVLSAVAFTTWYVACGRMTPSDYTDLGLYSATTPLFWSAMVLAVVGLVLAVRARTFSHLAAAASVLTLIAILYSTPSVLEGTPRVEAVYRHLGIAQHLATTGQLERYLDAYFNWPGFFSLLAQLQGATGAPDLLALATWAPTVAAVAYLPPVLLIARSLNPSPRVQWLTAAVFVMVNWSGQDYLAPQTFAFWCLLSIAGIVMTILRRGDDPDAEGISGPIVDRVHDRLPRFLGRTFGTAEGRSWIAAEGTRVRLTRGQWAGTHLVLGVAVVAVSAAHQLTPFMLLLMLFALWVVGRSPHWWLWALTGAVIAFWLAVPALPFVRGHLPGLLAGVGGLFTGGDDGPGLGSRTASGTAAHQLVVSSRIGQTLALWILAGLGTLLMIAGRRRIREAVVLAGTPFLLIPLQAYGGEMLIRAFLFGLPLVSFLIAVFLLWVCAERGWRTVVLAVVLLALAGTTVVTRYGNERGESFRPQEIAALGWFYRHTDPGATVVQFTQNTPRPLERYASNTWTFLNDGSPGPRWRQQVTPSRLISLGLLTRELGVADRREGPVYVVYNRGQGELAELSGNTSADALQHAAEQMDADPRVTRIYRNADAEIWRLDRGVRLVTGRQQGVCAAQAGTAGA